MPLSKGELAANPPKEPLVSLASIVRDWQWRFPRHRRDTVVTFCAEAPTLTVAIDRACACRKPDGKMHNHQSRVTHAAREALRLELQMYKKSIKRDVLLAWQASSPDDPFDVLHDWVEACSGPGIGPVTVYDVATRIGAHPSLDAEPTSLYLHAGCRAGWLAMCPEPSRWRGVERVRREQMPVELQGIPADEVEDLCCTYRTIYHQLEDRGQWPQEEGSHE